VRVRPLPLSLPLALFLSLPLFLAPVQTDPTRILTDRLGFSAAEVDQARSGQPVVKVLTMNVRDELGMVGAIRLSGKKERLKEWLRNIEHFRNSAQLGTTHVVPMPPAAAAFAGVPAEPKVRDDLLGWAAAYVNNGATAYPDELRQLMQQARAMRELAPEFSTYVAQYPKKPLKGVDQLLYWSAIDTGSTPIVSVHHLVVYHPPGREVWIADKTIYATRYIDAGVLAIALYDAPDGNGFYAIVKSRVTSSELSGAGARLFRGSIERNAADTVKVYLEWLRDSLAQS
jgi:hypothetical protein